MKTPGAGNLCAPVDHVNERTHLSIEREDPNLLASHKT